MTLHCSEDFSGLSALPAYCHSLTWIKKKKLGYFILYEQAAYAGPTVYTANVAKQWENTFPALRNLESTWIMNDFSEAYHKWIMLYSGGKTM